MPTPYEQKFAQLLRIVPPSQRGKPDNIKPQR
jgi:hypothetical protein